MPTLRMQLQTPQLSWTIPASVRLTSTHLPLIYTLPPKRLVLTLLAAAVGLPYRTRMLDDALVALRQGVRVLDLGHITVRGRTVTVQDASFLLTVESHDLVLLQRIQVHLRAPARRTSDPRMQDLVDGLYILEGVTDQNLITALVTSLGPQPGQVCAAELASSERPDGAVWASVTDQPHPRLFGGRLVPRDLWVWRVSDASERVLAAHPVGIGARS